MYDIGIAFEDTKIAIGLVEGMTLKDTITIARKSRNDATKTANDMAKEIRLLLFRNLISMEHVNTIGVTIPCTHPPIEQIAQVLTSFIYMIQPQELCIGQEMSHMEQLALPALAEQMQELLWEKEIPVTTKIILAKSDNDAGMLGALLAKHALHGA